LRSKFGTLDCGFLKYMNTGIQIIRVSIVGDPLQVGYKSGGSIWQIPSSYLKKTVLTAGQLHNRPARSQSEQWPGARRN
jgi:hypothetical protein